MKDNLGKKIFFREMIGIHSFTHIITHWLKFIGKGSSHEQHTDPFLLTFNSPDFII